MLLTIVVTLFLLAYGVPTDWFQVSESDLVTEAPASAAFAAAGIARLQIESDPLTFWKESHYHRQSDVYLQENLGGSLFLHTVEESNAESAAPVAAAASEPKEEAR